MAGPGYVEAEENKYIKYFCIVSKIVVVVLHGHICVINEIWLYKPNLKSEMVMGVRAKVQICPMMSLPTSAQISEVSTL